MESINCLTNKSIILLEKNNLLKPLLKAELLREKIQDIKIENDIKAKILTSFVKQLGLSDENSFKEWLKKNHLTEEEFENLALRKIRMKTFCEKNFYNKTESHFLQRKNELDIVVYSLIRLRDRHKANELYMRIVEKEADFSELATQFSEGIERKTRGIVGPSPLGKAHPKLAELIKTSSVGEVQLPIALEGFYLILRVESYDEACLDEFMKEKMSEELLNQWLDIQTNELSSNLLSKVNEDK